MAKEEESIGRVKVYLDSFESKVRICDFSALDVAFTLGMDRTLMTNEEYERYYSLSRWFNRDCKCAKRYD